MKKVRLFLASELGQNVTNVFYGLGASVVILGALFKILHFPGAEEMLIAGMGTEAFLFALGSLEFPHKMYEWDRIFPALGAAHGEEVKGGKEGALGGSSDSLLDALIQSGKINPDDIKKLGDGFAQLNATASELTKLSKATISSDKIANSLAKANESVDAFSKAQESSAKNITAVTGDLVSSFNNINTKVAKNINSSVDALSSSSANSAKEMDSINKNLTSINSVYELQLKQANNQIEALKQQMIGLNAINSDMNSIKAAYADSVTESQEYKSEAKKLKKQISELNNVYGNMLNALNVNS